MANKESAIQNQIMTALSAEGFLTHRQIVGTFRYLHNDGVIHVGTPGMPDIYAVVPKIVTADDVGRTIGVYVGLEVKTMTGKQRKNQVLYQHAVEKRGGIYLVSRSADQAIEGVRRTVVYNAK